eukprot:836188_1
MEAEATESYRDVAEFLMVEITKTIEFMARRRYLWLETIPKIVDAWYTNSELVTEQEFAILIDVSGEILGHIGAAFQLFRGSEAVQALTGVLRQMLVLSATHPIAYPGMMDSPDMAYYMEEVDYSEPNDVVDASITHNRLHCSNMTNFLRRGMDSLLGLLRQPVEIRFYHGYPDSEDERSDGEPAREQNRVPSPWDDLSNVHRALEILSSVAHYMVDSIKVHFLSSVSVTYERLLQLPNDRLKAIEDLNRIQHLGKTALGLHAELEDENAAKHLNGLFELALWVKAIQCPYMASRMGGLTRLKTLVSDANKFTRYPDGKRPEDVDMLGVRSPPSPADRYSLVFVQHICRHLVSHHNIVDLLFGDQYHHQLVSRSGDIVNILADYDTMQFSHLATIWNACRSKHSSVTETLYNIIADLATHLRPEKAQYLFSKIIEVPEAEITVDLLNMALRFSLNALAARDVSICASDVEAANLDEFEAQAKRPVMEAEKVEKQEMESSAGHFSTVVYWYGVDFFWKLFMSATASPLIKVTAYNRLEETLKWPVCQLLRLRFVYRCVSNLEQRQEVAYSLRLATVLLESLCRSDPTFDCSLELMKLESKRNLMATFYSELLSHNESQPTHNPMYPSLPVAFPTTARAPLLHAPSSHSPAPAILQLAIETVSHDKEEKSEKDEKASESGGPADSESVPAYESDAAPSIDVPPMADLSHSPVYQLQQRLNFLHFVCYKCARIVVDDEAFERVWEAFVVNPVIMSDVRDVVFGWLEKALKLVNFDDRQIILRKSVGRIVKKLIPAMDFDRLSEKGFIFFQHYFRWVNWSDHVFEPVSRVQLNQYVMLKFDVVGMDQLWEIAFRCENDKVAGYAMSFIQKLHATFHSSLRGRLNEKYEQSISIVMKRLMDKAREPNHQLEVKRCFLLLEMFLEKFAGSHRPKHSTMDSVIAASPRVITLRCACKYVRTGMATTSSGTATDTTGTATSGTATTSSDVDDDDEVHPSSSRVTRHSEIAVRMKMSDTVGALRRKVAHEMNLSQRMLRIFRRGTVLSGNQFTLENLNFSHNELVLCVFKEVPEQSTEQKLPEDKEIKMSDEVEDDSPTGTTSSGTSPTGTSSSSYPYQSVCHPSEILSRLEYLDRLFSLLLVGGPVSEKCWDLLMKLPSNGRIFRAFQELSDDSDPSLSWKSLLSLKKNKWGIYGLRYSLQIVESLSLDIPVLGDQSSRWRELFISHGGLTHLISILLEWNFSSAQQGQAGASTEWQWLQSLALVLKILHRFVNDLNRVAPSSTDESDESSILFKVLPAALLPKLLETVRSVAHLSSRARSLRPGLSALPIGSPAVNVISPAKHLPPLSIGIPAVQGDLVPIGPPVCAVGSGPAMNGSAVGMALLPTAEVGSGAAPIDLSRSAQMSQPKITSMFGPVKKPPSPSHATSELLHCVVDSCMDLAVTILRDRSPLSSLLFKFDGMGDWVTDVLLRCVDQNIRHVCRSHLHDICSFWLSSPKVDPRFHRFVLAHLLTLLRLSEPAKGKGESVE